MKGGHQEVRIIGGLYRGKKLKFPSVQGLRPTPDRVRETLFNWLMNDIMGSRCLDAFAGSGALGFEALSRGAKEVCLLEVSSLVFEQLQASAKGFPHPGLRLKQVDARAYLQTAKESYDIVFLDPPFHEDYLSDCLRYLAQNLILIPGGMVYVESADELTVLDSWIRLKGKKAGQVYYTLLEKPKL